jgi:hypothetical protein
LGEAFNRNLELQVKLQQAQFLASRLRAKNAGRKGQSYRRRCKKLYRRRIPNTARKKSARSRTNFEPRQSGRRFCQISRRIFQDPGSKDKGGLYEKVTKGKMVPALKARRSRSNPVSIAENLVETPYGYHIIKLEKKGEGKDPKRRAGGNLRRASYFDYDDDERPEQSDGTRNAD